MAHLIRDRTIISSLNRWKKFNNGKYLKTIINIEKTINEHYKMNEDNIKKTEKTNKTPEKTQKVNKKPEKTNKTSEKHNNQSIYPFKNLNNQDIIEFMLTMG